MRQRQRYTQLLFLLALSACGLPTNTPTTTTDTLYVQKHDTVVRVDTFPYYKVDTVTTSRVDTVRQVVRDTVRVVRVDTVQVVRVDTTVKTVVDTVFKTQYDTVTKTVVDSMKLVQAQQALASEVQQFLTLNQQYTKASHTIDSLKAIPAKVVYDTTMIRLPGVVVHDTVKVPITIHDTVKVPVTIHDTVTIKTTVHDTVKVPTLVHDTIRVGTAGSDTVLVPVNAGQVYKDTLYIPPTWSVWPQNPNLSPPLLPGEYNGILCDSLVVVHTKPDGTYYVMHEPGSGTKAAGVPDTVPVYPKEYNADIQRPYPWVAVVVQGADPNRYRVAYLPGDGEVLRAACYNGPSLTFSTTP